MKSIDLDRSLNSHVRPGNAFILSLNSFHSSASRSWFFVQAPYANDVVDESSIEDHSLGMVWKEFFFMYPVINSGIGRCPWGAHSSPVQLL